MSLRDRADRLRASRVPFVQATVVRAERPTSAKAGDRALVLPDGTIEGFVGGSCAESTVRAQGLRLLRSGESTLLRITPDTAPPDALGAAVSGVVTVGNPCLSGGTLEIFMEAMLPAALVLVSGDAPVARALLTVGSAVGYDLRPVPDDLVVPPDTEAVVVASHGHDEERVLVAALRAEVRYVCLVASRRRGAAVLASLPASIDASRVHTPAGLDIGARTAPEVALSILAELIATRPRSAAPAAAVAMVTAAPTTATLAAEAVDPVCGMTVAVAATSLSSEHGGRTWYFCGPGCLRSFAEDPARHGG